MKKALAAVAFAGVVAMASTALAAAGDRTVGRISGADRYATAVAISQKAFPNGALEVYVARGDAFADALAGSSLTRNGPVLLVPSCGTVPQIVVDEVNRLHPTGVFALGGSSAVCDGVLDQLRGPAGQAPPSDAVTVSGEGEKNTDAFRLSGGSYKVSYSFNADCSYDPFLQFTTKDGGEILPSGQGPRTGEDNLFNVDPGEYYVHMITEAPPKCPWSITFTSF